MEKWWFLTRKFSHGHISLAAASSFHTRVTRPALECFKCGPPSAAEKQAHDLLCFFAVKNWAEAFSFQSLVSLQPPVHSLFCIPGPFIDQFPAGILALDLITFSMSFSCNCFVHITIAFNYCTSTLLFFFFFFLPVKYSLLWPAWSASFSPVKTEIETPVSSWNYFLVLFILVLLWYNLHHNIYHFQL